MSTSRGVQLVSGRRPAKRIGKGRVARGTLTRSRVLAEALILLDRDGPEALTIRRLAEHLGVSPMALYNHIGSKQDLLQGLAKELIESAEFASDDPDWRERIAVCFRQLRRICLAHPSITRLMETADVAPLSVFGPMELTLAALREAGIAPQDGLRAYFLLTNFTLGQVAYEVRGPFHDLDPAQALRDGRLQEAGFENIERAAALQTWDFDAAFEFGLSVILTGLEQRQTHC